ncbi:MAG: glycoside hydrolase family 65 protein [Defluviitaleaceae bacterium]|nr:glycoside hydrolase family 65 protein [Defluviitaleaceae bacterium]
MAMIYKDPWVLKENKFDHLHLGKTEAIMSQGNGYMGLRACAEERYTGECRGLFVSGTFNKFDETEVTELPNCADMTEMEIFLNGKLFSLQKGNIKSYSKELCLKSGELKRSIVWCSDKGERYNLSFLRIVSLKNLHTIAQKVTITPLSGDTTLSLACGINAQITNSGSQHFSEGAKRFYEKRYMQLVATTTESKIDFVFSTDTTLSVNSKKQIAMNRRRIFSKYDAYVAKGQTVTIEKISTVHTTRDKQTENLSLEQLQEFALKNLKQQVTLGYAGILQDSKTRWDELVWQNIPIEIETDNIKDILAVRFAQYHLQIMAPAHDNRMNIGAKGLSGEGYKGHTFWDTEIFALPYYIFSQPSTALSLLQYRYLSLPGARQKAADGGYKGAQYPWESAWLTDGEVTPLFGGADIVTGLPTPILTGQLEIHITCDVVYGIWQYYKASQDESFMREYGYEIVFDCANFWASRLQEGSDGLLHINNVIGPDEYKDGIDDDAFTNHFAKWNLLLAVEYYNKLQGSDVSDVFERLKGKISLDCKLWEDKASKTYVPMPNERGIIPQNRTFLDLKQIDLTKYKNQTQVGTIYKDYNQHQICNMQVCKQADVLLLILLMENLFSPKAKQANWNYYEPRTLHDSSLSLSTHSILASDMGQEDLAYELFERACNIDMGENMSSSNEGIHAGSIGGIWQCVVFGFAGFRVTENTIRLAPKLPKHWRSLNFYLWLKGEKIKVTVTHKGVDVSKEGYIAIPLNSSPF